MSRINWDDLNAATNILSKSILMRGWEDGLTDEEVTSINFMLATIKAGAEEVAKLTAKGMARFWEQRK